MKKYIVLVSIIAIFIGCSSGGDSGGDNNSGSEPAVNNAPAVPSLVSPTNSLLCTDNTLEFKWNAATDLDGDAIRYKVEVSKNNSFSAIDKTATISATSTTFTLEKGVAYYWRVQAIDSKNKASDFSQVYSLYTEGVGVANHLPFAPELVNPVLSSTLASGSVSLEWIGSDTDGDPVKYDVYFDENNPPTTLVSENLTAQTFDVTTSSGKTYFWKVVVKDDNGGETIGQIWKFSTE